MKEEVNEEIRKLKREIVFRGLKGDYPALRPKLDWENMKFDKLKERVRKNTHWIWFWQVCTGISLLISFMGLLFILGN